MAAGSLFLPSFLLAKQVLLNNFMSDIPPWGSPATEWTRVEREPHRWNIRIIRTAMVIFGLVSTAFDLLTFYASSGWRQRGKRSGPGGSSNPC